MPNKDAPCRVFVTSPLESEYVEQIRMVGQDRVEVLYDPALLPPTRYIADHAGPQEFALDAEQRARWSEMLREANVLWDFPKIGAGEPGLMEQAPNLQWVQTTSAGVGPLVKKLGVADSDIVVTTASGVHARPLAEFAFMAMLMHVKNLARVQAEQKKHNWERFCSDELDCKTLAIVGPGRIGQQVASLGRSFGMRVTALGRTTSEQRRKELGVHQLFSREQLHQMLSGADAVVLSCPHTPETENLIDADAFAAMKNGAIFVNIARGQVVDEPALISNLQSGKIAFAALDVFATEPLPTTSPLWDMPNVLVSPHSGSTSVSENRKITEIFCHNLENFLNGRTTEMINILDKRRLY